MYDYPQLLDGLLSQGQGQFWPGNRAVASDHRRSETYLATAAALIASGLVVALVNVVAISLRQSLTPPALIGRVTAVHRVLCWGALPLGAGFAGLVGQFLGVRAAIASCGVAVLLLSAATLFSLLRVPSEEFAAAAS
jgi:hypothetical protein